MINATFNTPATYLKEPVAAVAGPQPVTPVTPQANGTGASGASNFRRPNQKKLFGFDMRPFLTVVGLTAFFLLSMVGVIIAIRQRVNRTAVAPNAPESKPAAFVQNTSNCTLAWNVAPPPSPSPSPSVSPSPSPSPSPTPSPTPSVSPSPSPTYTCNSSCTTDAQCQTANAQYVCSGDHGNRCRLDSNRASESCTPAPQTYACNSDCTTNAQCQTVSSSYVCYQNRCRLDSNPTAGNCQPTVIVYPSPTVGCNQTCATNADCSNSNHICYTTSDGSNRCRLESYVNSESCTPPSVVYTPTQQVVVQQQQPVTQPLPPELPKTGPEDWGKWLGAGLATLGIGAILLLLL